MADQTGGWQHRFAEAWSLSVNDIVAASGALNKAMLAVARCPPPGFE